MDLRRIGPAANLRYVTNSATSGFCRVLHSHVCTVRTRSAKLLALVRALLQSTQFVCPVANTKCVAPCVRTRTSEIECIAVLRNTSLALEKIRPYIARSLLLPKAKKIIIALDREIFRFLIIFIKDLFHREFSSIRVFSSSLENVISTR